MALSPSTEIWVLPEVQRVLHGGESGPTSAISSESAVKEGRDSYAAAPPPARPSSRQKMNSFLR